MKKSKIFFCLALIFLLQITLISCGSSGVNTQAELPVTKPPEPTTEPKMTPEPEVGTQSNPIPKGSFYVQTRGNDLSIQLGVAEAIRGEEAYQAIIKANTFNIPPTEGMEYVIVVIVVEYISSSSPDQVLEFSSTDFLGFSKNQIIPNNTIVAGLEPILNAKLNPGERAEGYIVLQVHKDDPSPLIVFRPSFGNTDEQYFFSIQ